MKNRQHGHPMRMDEIYGCYNLLMPMERINQVHTEIAAEELAEWINEQGAAEVAFTGLSEAGSIVRNNNGVWEANPESIQKALQKAKKCGNGTIFCSTSHYWTCTLDRLEVALKQILKDGSRNPLKSTNN